MDWEYLPLFEAVLVSRKQEAGVCDLSEMFPEALCAAAT